MRSGIQIPLSTKSGIGLLYASGIGLLWNIAIKLPHHTAAIMRQVDVEAHAVPDLLANKTRLTTMVMPLHANGVCRRIPKLDGGSPGATGTARCIRAVIARK